MTKFHEGQAELAKGIKAPATPLEQAIDKAVGDEQADSNDAGSPDSGDIAERQTFSEALREANPGIENTPGFRPLPPADEEGDGIPESLRRTPVQAGA
jgi:hypothetical protein